VLSLFWVLAVAASYKEFRFNVANSWQNFPASPAEKFGPLLNLTF
jgi:hypothetical protein